MPKTILKSKAHSVRQVKSQKEKAIKESGDITVEPASSRFRRPSRKFIVILIIIGLILLFYYNKKWLVAASVNGQPITNLELQLELNKSYRQQALNKLINDRIFSEFEKEALRKGTSVTPQEITQKISEVENQYGGQETFNSLLTQQGISRSDFEKQIKINLLAEKFYENDIKPTDDEIKKFMDDENNKLAPEATDAAKFKQLAETEVKQDKLSTKLREKFQDLKSKVITF